MHSHEGNLPLMTFKPAEIRVLPNISRFCFTSNLPTASDARAPG
jgi:hypothetical protein